MKVRASVRGDGELVEPSNHERMLHPPFDKLRANGYRCGRAKRVPPKNFENL